MVLPRPPDVPQRTGYDRRGVFDQVTPEEPHPNHFVLAVGHPFDLAPLRLLQQEVFPVLTA
jgi:hypothetical protein